MYEIKVRMMNEEMAKKLLTPLDLGAPDAVETSVHTYLTDKEATQSLKEREGSLTHIVTRRHQAGFAVVSEDIDAEQAEKLKQRHPPTVTFTMTRTLWRRADTTIALNVVEGLGVFLEFQGGKYEALKAWPKKIGFVETHYLTRAYDELN